MKITTDVLTKILNRCPNLRNLKCPIPPRIVRYRKFPQCDKMESLFLNSYDGKLIVSLCGKCPNLKNLSVNYEQSFANMLSAAFLNLLKLKKLDIIVTHDFFHGGPFENFWWSARLRSLSFDSSKINTDDNFFIKISTTFVNLEELREINRWAELTKRGFAALASLKKLHTLEFSQRLESEFCNADIDEGCRQLACLGGLRNIWFHHYFLSPETVSRLVRHCPELRELRFLWLEGVSNSHEMVAFVNSLYGFRQQHLTITAMMFHDYSTDVIAALDCVNAAANSRSISFIWPC